MKKKLANSSPPEGRGEREEASTATCQNTLQHARLEPAHTFAQCIVEIHWKEQMLIRNVNQITSTSVQVQLFILGFHDTDLFVLIPALLPNQSYYSNCMELDARLALVWHSSLAAWRLFPGKQQGLLHMYLCRKLHANSSLLKSRSTAVMHFYLAVLLDWSEREVKCCPDLAVTVQWSWVIGGKN